MSIPLDFIAGGSLVTPTGKETLTDLSTSDPSALTSASMGKLLKLYNSGRIGSIVTLPDASTLAATTLIKQLGVALNHSSPPVAIFNGGTPGTDPILEVVLPGGAVGCLSNYDTSSNEGKWAWQGTPPLKGYPWDMRSPVTKTLGASSEVTTIAVAGKALVMLSATVGCFTYADNNADIQLIAFSVNAAGTINSVSNKTTLRSDGTNVYQAPQLIKQSSTQVACTWWDNTNAKNEYVAVGITGGNPPTIGSPGSVIDDSAITANDRVVKGGAVAIQDRSSTSFWHIGGMVSTAGSNSYYFTASGTTLTLAANNKFNTAANMNCNAVSTASAKAVCIAGGSPFKFQLLSYAGGVITSSSTCEGMNLATLVDARLEIIDETSAANTILLFTGVGSSTAQTHGVVSLDLSSTIAQNWFRQFKLMRTSSIGNLDITYPGKWAPYYGKGEIAWFNSGGETEYIDFLNKRYTGVSTSTAGNWLGADTMESSVQVLDTSYAKNAQLVAIEFEPTTRLLVAVSMNTPLSGNQVLTFNTYRIPRRS